VAWIVFVLVLVAEGLFVGAIGRLVVPGPDPMSIAKTVVVGIGGSLLAGVVARALFNSYAGLFLSVAGAALIVWLLRRWDERQGRRPARPGQRRGRWFVGPGMAGGVWTSGTGRRRDGDETLDRRTRGPRSGRHHDSDEIVDAEVVDEIPADAQVVDAEVVEPGPADRTRPGSRRQFSR
jgi:uncharacterized membrane protein YeaQ/YmgE (transglycosylase-associated protein family)